MKNFDCLKIFYKANGWKTYYNKNSNAKTLTLHIYCTM